MRGPSHEVVAFAAAAVIHAAALFVLHAAVGDLVAAPRAPAPARSAPSIEVDVDLEDLADLESLSEAATGNAPHDVAPPRIERIARYVVPRVGSGAPSGGGGTTTNALEPSDAAPTAEVALEESSEAAPPSKPIDLGIGPDGWQRWVTPSKPGEAPRAERTPPRKNRFQVFNAPPVSTTGGLQEGLEKHDRELGLGPSGRVLSAMHAASHITAAPYVGTARFDVTVLRTGVVEVTLGAASGQVEQWKQVAEHIANDLRAAPPRVTPPREGVKFVVEIVAEETLPNGTKITSLHGPRIEVTAPKLKSTQKTQEQLLEDNPTAKDANPQALPPIDLELPGVYLAESGKVCSYRLGLSPLGLLFQGGCDPSHIGAKPQRMVRARVIEEQLF
jgi:hypothetical protein